MGIEEKIEEILRNEGVIEIRGHHIVRFLRYVIEGLALDEPDAFIFFANIVPHYTKDTIEKEFLLYKMLVDNPNLKVKIVDTPDFNCKEICRRYRGPVYNNIISRMMVIKCDGCTAPSDRQYDRAKAESFGVETGRTYSSGELVEHLRNWYKDERPLALKIRDFLNNRSGNLQPP